MEVAEQTKTECPEAWCHSHMRAHRGATLLHFAGMYTYTHINPQRYVLTLKKTVGGLMNNCGLVSNHPQVRLSSHR